MKPTPQPPKLRVVDADAGATGVNQPARGIIVRQQQGPEPRPGTLWLGPAHDDEFLAMQALGFEPQAAFTRHIGRIRALGDDPLHAQLTRLA